MEKAFPLGIRRLKESKYVTVTCESFCFTTAYSVSSHQSGVILRITKKGSKTYHVTDAEGQLVAVFRHKHPWFSLPSMKVQLCQLPVVMIKTKEYGNKPNIVFMESNNLKILELNPTVFRLSSREYKILGRSSVQIGSMRTDWSDYDIQYPADLSVRYKIALIASVIFNDANELSSLQYYS